MPKVTHGIPDRKREQRSTAKDSMANLPGWATWTPPQAAQWITENVTTLQTAKVCLIHMAEAILHLRDYILIIDPEPDTITPPSIGDVASSSSSMI